MYSKVIDIKINTWLKITLDISIEEKMTPSCVAPIIINYHSN